ncbi:class I SAM-dependent methyltransferase [Bacillus salacetis]|uniref:Class I SAM-dependent methyltransferase n=1 Tax=Bacillus salacetis TaxID=2315464 RepID=A0A3A1R9H5_9BACI|nr:class I SAM-dependent methyltransferase [Bacillus salacetis]RIW38424.1 class I SAM-dependent methyltransferase [Bacillus salacetis]
MSSYLDFLALYGIGGAHPGGILLTKELMFREEITEEMSVLDIGCGTCQTAVFMKEMFGSRVVGIENHPIMLKKAENRIGAAGVDVELIEASAEEIPFGEAEFDLITSESVLSFVNRSAVFSEVERVLKPGGLFIAVEMTAERDLSLEDRKELVDFYGVGELFTEKDWEKCVKTAGFVEVTIEKPDFPLLSPEPVIEFDLSDEIPEEIHEMLDRHEEYVDKYKELLGVRIIKCKK